MTEPVRSPDDRTPRWSAHIHESLDAHEAQAAELRRELDDLRRTLEPADPGPGGGSHRRPKPRRRTRVLRVLVVLVVLAVAVGLAVLLRHRTAPAAAPAGTPAPSSAPSATGSVAGSDIPSAGPSTGSSTGPSTAAGADLPPWPGRSVAEPPGLPTTGPGADRPGSEITLALDPDRQHVEVYERALLTPGSGPLALRPADPADVPAAARSLVAGLPGVQDMHADVDGRPAAVSSDPQGWKVVPPAGVPAGHVVLRYRLDGALGRHEPAPAGRYTLVLRPLTPSAGRGAGDAVVVRIVDDQVTELYCPGASDQLCGATAGALHTATLPRGAPAVVIGLVTLRS